MNIVRLSAPFLGLLISAAAVAAEGTQDFEGVALSTRARAEVKIELAEARAAGLPVSGETYGSFSTTQIESTRVRYDVRAELAAARAAGELNQRGETYGSFAGSELGSTLARASVRKDAVRASAAGAELSRGYRND